MAVNELIVVLGYSIIGKSVILLLNINYLQLQVVLTTRRALPNNTARQVVSVVNGLSVMLTVAFFVVTNISKFSLTIRIPTGKKNSHSTCVKLTIRLACVLYHQSPAETSLTLFRATLMNGNAFAIFK